MQIANVTSIFLRLKLIVFFCSKLCKNFRYSPLLQMTLSTGIGFADILKTLETEKMELPWPEINIQALIQHIVTISFVTRIVQDVIQLPRFSIQLIPWEYYVSLGLTIGIIDHNEISIVTVDPAI